MMRNRFSLMLSSVFLVAVALTAPAPAGAQIQSVKQAIYGMDCAPCAYGVELRLRRLDGVGSVRLSLNEGLAELTLDPGNTITLGEIRHQIRRAGFSARDAEIEIRGALSRDAGKWVLDPGTGEQFLLDAVPAGAETSDEVTVRGRVPVERELGAWRLIPGRER